ncbi:MAG: serine hydroxymethyltransferase [Clostridia bacterium]|nr:serine hydroxymethyltransferase [Clostridia bacterium]
MSQVDEIFKLIDREKARQAQTIELIASENFVSENCMKAAGSCLTNKYAEGYPGKRYYGGCDVVDEIESRCIDAWKQVFNTNYHVNVQPHSGSQANCAAYSAVIKPGDTVLSMSLDNGAHLTHGSSVNFSGKLYNMVFYGIDSRGYIDMEDVRRKALEFKPALIVTGASAYPRIIDFQAFRAIADEVGALLMTDMAHIAGLVATGRHPSPFEAGCDIITTTTHKTLRGPRGGLIFCKPELKKKIDSAIFPGNQGGPLEHIIAAKAIAAYEAMDPAYSDYIDRVISNCNTMANRFVDMGYDLVTGGTDNHLFLLDLTKSGVTGKVLQETLDLCRITLNKNCVPHETRSPQVTSGARIGTAAMTTRGMSSDGFLATAGVIDKVIKALQGSGISDEFIDARKSEVDEILNSTLTANG